MCMYIKQYLYLKNKILMISDFYYFKYLQVKKLLILSFIIYVRNICKYFFISSQLFSKRTAKVVFTYI